MADEWYVDDEGATRGPFDWEELRRMVRAGRVRPDTMLRQGRGNWAPARRVRGLFDGIAPDPAPADEPALRLDDPGPDEDYRLPVRRGSGRAAVTAYGVATLVLASLLTIAGCVSGVGSAFCFAGYNALSAPPPAPNGTPGASVGAGCGAIIGVLFLAAGIILAFVMAVHLLLGGGHFATGFGVLRRRQWARILALVLSVFTLSYGLLALYQIGSLLAQSGPPSGSDLAWLVLAGVVALLFVAHAVLTWVVMFHPACAADFRTAGPDRTDDGFDA